MCCSFISFLWGFNGISDLQRQLQLKNEDIEELKADKRDLRSLVAKQKDELEAAKAGTSILAAQLQKATLEIEECKKRMRELEPSKRRSGEGPEVSLAQ